MRNASVELDAYHSCESTKLPTQRAMLVEALSDKDQTVLDMTMALFQNLIEQAKTQEASSHLLAILSLLEKKVIRLAKQELKSRQYAFNSLLEEKNFYEKEAGRLAERNEELEKTTKRCFLELEICKLDLPEALLKSRNEIDSLREDSKKVFELEKANIILHAELRQVDVEYSDLLRGNGKLKDSCELLKEELEYTKNSIRELEEELDQKRTQYDHLLEQSDRLYKEKNTANVVKNELLRENEHYANELINLKTSIINLKAANESFQSRMRVEKAKLSHNSRLLDDVSDLLYCGKCESHFGDSLPVIGICGHSICRNCFENLIRTDCPYCAEGKAFKKGIVNGLIIAILRALNQNSSRSSPSPVDSPPTVVEETPTTENRPLGKTKKRTSILNLFRNN